MTKQQALKQYDEALLNGWGMDKAAAALAECLRPKPKATPITDLSSKAFAGLRLIKPMKCAAGHAYNGAGCKVCVRCLQAKWPTRYPPQSGFVGSARSSGHDTPWVRNPLTRVPEGHRSVAA